MSHVNMVMLGSLCTQVRGIAYGKDEIHEFPVGDTVPLLRATNILETGELDLDNVLHVNANRVSQKQLLKKGDVLISASTGSKSAIGKPARVRVNSEVTFGAFCKALRPNTKVVDANYFWFLFCRPEYRSHISNVVGGANINNIRNEHIDEMLVPLPPLETQKHIARVLEQADQLRKQAQQMESELNQLAQSLFLEMFGDPIENAKKWQTASIGDISPQKGEIVDGPFGSSLKPDCYVESGVRVIRNYNIKPGRFDDSEYKFVTQEKYEEIKRSNVIPGDILISTKGTVGNLCICPELQGSSVLSASGTVRWRMTNKHWVSSFIVFQAQMPSYQAYLARSTGGAVQKYLNLSGIRDLKLIAPPYDLQCAFVRKLDEVVASKMTLANNSATLNTLFQSLMQRAFNGDLTAPGTKAA